MQFASHGDYIRVHPVDGIGWIERDLIYLHTGLVCDGENEVDGFQSLYGVRFQLKREAVLLPLGCVRFDSGRGERLVSVRVVRRVIEIVPWPWRCFTQRLPL